MSKIVMAIGSDLISDQIKKFDDVDVAEEDDDIDIICDVLEYVDDIDFIIINTMLSDDKSLKIARRAREVGLRVIAIVDKEKVDKTLIVGLVGMGVFAFADYNELFKVQEYINAYPQSYDFEELSDNADREVAMPAKVNKKTTIAMLGTMRRIGTTTQAIRLAKYLNDNGFKTAYIELNDTNYISELMDSYNDVNVDTKIGKITYAGIDMYRDPTFVSEILKMPYLFYIYDFGDMHNIKSEISWLDKDVKIVIAGTKPTELPGLQFALQRTFNQNSRYIFSFSHDSEHEDVRQQMQNKGKWTFFSGWVPDPFIGSAEEWYKDLVALPIGKNKLGGKKDEI